MTRDRIDARAAELFAAARAERPGRELGARVEGATESSAPSAGPKEQPRRPLLVRSLLAAIVCGGVLGLLLLPRSRDTVIISAERSPRAAAAKPETALPSAAAPNDIERSPPRAPATPASEALAPEALVAEMDASRSRAPRATGANTPAPARAVPEQPARPDVTQAATADSPVPVPAPVPPFSDELGVLKQIRQELRDGDGSAALALLDRYDTGEYGSRLALEASVLRIEALDAVGRRTEAQVLARRLVRDNPDSPLAERAQRFLDRTEPARAAPGSQP